VTSDYTNYLASWTVAVSAGGTAVTAGNGGTVASVDFLSSSRLVCVEDPADYVQLRTLAPGQLVSLFGTDLAPALPFFPASGVSASTDNFGVFFNGIPAPILYSSGQQINAQVPFELAGQTSAQMQIVNTRIPSHLTETRTFAVADRQPAIFLSMPGSDEPVPRLDAMRRHPSIGPAAIALNTDGTLNDCTNPAVAGSTVTLFANGLGQLAPNLTTGTAAATPAVTLTPGVVFLDPNLAPLTTTTKTIPGTLNGVERVQFQVPSAPASTTAYPVTPTQLGVNLRERLALIWIRSK
jgi:uncharacterized protein (TIGR03437 family)